MSAPINGGRVALYLIIGAILMFWLTPEKPRKVEVLRWQVYEDIGRKPTIRTVAASLKKRHIHFRGPAPAEAEDLRRFGGLKPGRYQEINAFVSERSHWGLFLHMVYLTFIFNSDGQLVRSNIDLYHRGTLD